MSSWFEVLLTGLAGIGSTYLFIRNEFRNLRDKQEEKLGELKKEIEDRIKEMEQENKASVGVERDERKREVDRLGSELENLRELPKSVALIAQSVENLAGRFGDSKTATDRAMDEVKHTMRGIDAKLDAQAVAIAANANGRQFPRRQQRGQASG